MRNRENDRCGRSLDVPCMDDSKFNPDDVLAVVMNL